jgi:geranylgeranyl transferase type-2 subunit beta
MSLSMIWNIARRDVDIPKNAPTEFFRDKHKAFLLSCSRNRDSYEYVMSEYLRLSGIYWFLAAMDVIKTVEDCDKELIVEYVKSNKRADGGFAAAEGHDSHLLHTLSAVQSSIILDRLDIVCVK